MIRKGVQVGLALFLAGGMLFLALTLLERQTQAQAGTTIYVAPGGDCGGMIPCYDHPQDAVHAASTGDEIRVAQGTYTGVQNVPSLNTATFTATQVVVITKTITIRGGYTTTNWTTPDPAANATTLDAQGQGRVVYITGDISPTVETLRIAGGDAAGLGGDPWGNDAGGGVYVYVATPIISKCVVYSNTASTTSSGSGGGLFLHGSAATLDGNTVVSNTASTASYGHGGGLFLWGSDATLSGNTVQGDAASTASWGYGGGLFLLNSDATLRGNTVVSNRAGTADRGWGGGLYVWYSAATLSGNTVVSNTAGTADQGYGGGLYLSNSEATLCGTTVQGNTASTVGWGYGGGVYVWQSAATLSGNTIVSNTATLSPIATGQGGGVLVRRSSPVTLTNNLVADNQANTQGSGLWIDGEDSEPTSARLVHTTIADNRGSGQGVFVREYATLAFTNTIVAGHHSVGITVTTGSTATLNATLWHGNGTDWGGAGTIITATVNCWGDPAFLDPGAGDYHIGPGSAALDAGVDAGVATDIDGDPRPIGAGFDIGADECRAVTVYLPLTLKNYWR